MSKLKNLSDGVTGKGNKEYIRLYPEVPITRQGVMAFLYLFFGVVAAYSTYQIFFGDLTLGLILLGATALNAFLAIRDARKSKWGNEIE